MTPRETPFTTVEHDVDLCVVGGGMSGWAAAIAAAGMGRPRSS